MKQKKLYAFNEIDLSLTWSRFFLVSITAIICAISLCAQSVSTLDFKINQLLPREEQYKDIPFSIPQLNISYKISDLNYVDDYEKHMSPIYKFIHFVLNNMLGTENTLPSGYIYMDDYHFHLGKKLLRHEWGELMLRFWGLLLFVVLWLIAAILVPLIGCYYCCCRCTDQSLCETCDRKHDSLRRSCLFILMMILLTVMLFGILVAFWSNNFIEDGIEDVRYNAKLVQHDLGVYINTLRYNLEHLSDDNVREVTDGVTEKVLDFPHAAMENLMEVSKATSLHELLSFLKNLPILKNSLHTLERKTKELKNYAEQLRDGLRGVKREFFLVFDKCPMEDKDKLESVLQRYNIGNMDFGLHYDMIAFDPEILVAVKNYTGDARLIDYVEKGLVKFEQISIHLNDTVFLELLGIIDAISTQGPVTTASVYPFQRLLELVARSIALHGEEFGQVVDHYMGRLSKYRYIKANLSILVLFIIFIILLVGLCCGIFGKRVSDYDYKCSKGVGSKLLVIAAIIVFLTFTLLVLSSVIYFFIGAILYRGACIPMSDMNDEVYQTMDSQVDMNIFFMDASEIVKIGPTQLMPSHLITACGHNESIYSVLEKHDLFYMRNLYTDLIQSPGLEDALIKFAIMAGKFIIDEFKIYAEEDMKHINDFVNDTRLNNFDPAMFGNLFEELPQNNLSLVAMSFRSLANELSNYPAGQSILRNQAKHLDVYAKEIEALLIKVVKQIYVLVKKTKTLVQIKNETFTYGAQKIISEVNGAENFVVENGTKYVHGMANDLAYFVKKQVQRYQRHAFEIISTKFGDCKPLMRIYRVTWWLICDQITNPLNSYCFGSLIGLFTLIPMLCVIKKLKCLLNKPDKYPGPGVKCPLHCETQMSSKFLLTGKE